MTDTNERAVRIAAIRADYEQRTVLSSLSAIRVYEEAVGPLLAELDTLRTERAAVAAAARRGDWGEVIRIIGWEDM